MIRATTGALMGVMTPVLGKLTALLKEYDRLKGLHPRITSLRDELRSIKAALEDLSQLEEPSLQVKEWMNQLRELSYDIQDCIDDFVHGPVQDGAHDGLTSKIAGWLRTIQHYHQIGGNVDKLKERAVEVNDRPKRLKLDVVPSSSSAMAIDPRLSALFEEADRIIGFDGPRDELVNVLVGETDLVQERRVISIVGAGGIGKTTLANQVYKEVKSQFQFAVFASVSRTPDVKKILSGVLLEILDGSNAMSVDDSQRIKEDLSSLKVEYNQLVQKIRENLHNKRYFVLIDDIWSKQAWKDIQCAFPYNNNASWIMTTTRIQEVAESCSFPQVYYVYPMKHLDNDASKRLFLKRIFAHEDDCPFELKDVTYDILKKCDGLPLAIVNMASLLATKPTTKLEWVRVRNSLYSALEQDNELAVVRRILLLSYYDLPCYLKMCLLDLSAFPEDHEIDCERLVWRWAAEGLVVAQQGQNVEEIAEGYFNELINRNMIQSEEINTDGRVTSCRVHDIMLDLLISLSSEENFVAILNSQKCTTSTYKIRRLSLQGNCEEHHMWLDTGNFSHVRSVSVFGDCKRLPPLIGLQTLRVLDAVDCNQLEEDNVYIEDIGSLRQLRYLSLGPLFSRLPREIKNLRLLQTLDLTRADIRELPASIIELHQLVRLFVNVCVKFPSGFSNLRALQELKWFGCDNNSLDVVLELGQLSKLKKLHICWGIFDDTNGDEDRYKKCFLSSLCKLGEGNLQTLHIDGLLRNVDSLIDSWCPPPRHLQDFEIGSISHTIPSWISSLSALMFLCITVEQLEQEDMQVLKDLPALVSLTLEASNSKEVLTINRGGFQCLKQFSFVLRFWASDVGSAPIVDKTRGPNLLFGEGATPKLEKLSIHCRARDMVSAEGVASNFGISHLASLKQLRVSIACSGARLWEVEATLDAIHNACTLTPNPNLQLETLVFWSEYMAKDEEHKHDTYIAKEDHVVQLQAASSTSPVPDRRVPFTTVKT
ncbi:hypothetical protein CFC21_107546 [Triticum aestivum]|uniref:AAA+ ATPase domain-containing protein n=2 Tax=Triticum aestivum TaxID=4565 RepID=A0A3B6TE11_WHEAT|nr:disease resistance protein RGA5-like [Triticum aestivum]KAF7106841.1 hypothetical protein CFC21_107546 [Triticum aestivum]